MSNIKRLEHIAAIVEELGFASVADLSLRLGVSEMTIRRDLSVLEGEKRLQRTYGGAVSLRRDLLLDEGLGETASGARRASSLAERIDVLVATALNPKYDGLLLDSIRAQKALPIIAESLSVHSEETIVAVDNYQAAFELGQWAAAYAARRWQGQARLLDLTYYLTNTQARSHGFMDGLQLGLPAAQLVLSVDAQSRFNTAYQLTRDSLAVYPDINMIFTINDTTAWGAINACRDLEIDPQKLIVLPFGLEGETLKDALLNNDYCPAGLAMFPEIVGPVCIEAAIRAFNKIDLPSQLITPYAVLTAETLPEYYHKTPAGWEIRWEKTQEKLAIPLDISSRPPSPALHFPRGIGFVIPFGEHEWYQNLARSMQAYAGQFGINFEIVDVHQSLKDEIEIRRRRIAQLAAGRAQAGDVILIDSGPIAGLLAEALADKKELTIITNSVAVFEILRKNPDITLILTGGVYRQSSETLVGPTGETALSELRADKLFLTASGITLDFGLSHTNVSEVTIKQAMIRSARQVILLADHTYFGQESVIQLAPLNVVQTLITDDALPASIRLELTKLGIEIVLASME